MSTLGRKPASSIGGSRASIYSHASTARSFRTARGARSNHHNNKPLPWYKKPLITHAFYTDLQRGSWHIGFYTFILSIWTIFTSAFDVYCLDEAKPGSNHTGYYIISFDFVYVGNPHIRNLLIMEALFSLFFAIALFVTSVMLLDGLRKEQETQFKAWLITMGLFTCWRIVSWGFSAIVNDMIFTYHILMFIVWMILNVLDVLSWICIYSLYLELTDLTKLQDIARLKMNTMSSLPASRAASIYGTSSRPTSPYTSHHTTPMDHRAEEPLYAGTGSTYSQRRY